MVCPSAFSKLSLKLRPVYGFFDASTLRLQGYRTGRKFYNTTLNKKFKNERLNQSLRGEAFLTRYAFIDEVIISSSYGQRLSSRYQNQNIRLMLSYKFGKKRDQKSAGA